jgi:predicted dehydrogenase
MSLTSVELIGCGALAESVYAPVLAHLERAGRIRVTAVMDPDSARAARLGKNFPGAQIAQRLEDLPPSPDGLAIIASPPSVHAQQACALLAAGRHVLCEKPLATSVAEANTMIAAARAGNRLLAAGMMRRFYPAAQALREGLAAPMLGEPVNVEVAEGGRFSWNAASPKFFERSQGGVLLDLGSHVLDLLCHWFGEPAETTASHDALGGTNTNALLTARWPTGCRARVRLSWDTPLETGWRITATRGEWRWNGSPDDGLVLHPQNGNWRLHAIPQENSHPAAPGGWMAAFVRQIENILGAIAENQKLLAPAEDVLPSLRWLEKAGQQAQLLPQLWLSPEEQTQAAQLAKT